MHRVLAGAERLCLVARSLSKGRASLASVTLLASSITLTLVFGPDARTTLEGYAQDRQLDPQSLRQRYAATGLVACGTAHGAGQLTLANTVVTTAAHVLYDQNGRQRPNCRFVIETGGQEIATALEMDSAIVGSTDPYRVSAVQDWAAVRLARPLREAKPYPLTAAVPGAEVLFVARGAMDFAQGQATSAQSCRLRQRLETGAEGTREFAFDCAAGVGASGAGLLDAQGRGLIAIFVGYRSLAPDLPLPFSDQHYNYAITVEGAFRRAVERQAAVSSARN